MSPDYILRRPSKRDSSGIVELLVALANFEHLDPPDEASRKRIIRDIFSTRKLLNIFVAADWRSKKLVGYALYFYTYSSFLARPTLYLEDIFVLEEHRGRGIGGGLFTRCVEEAKKNDCGRMEWAVLTWNKNAIDFYEKLGAKRLDQWYTYRLTKEAMSEIVSRK